MSAYVIVDIDIHDEPGLAEYRRLVPATVEKYGGRRRGCRGRVGPRGGQVATQGVGPGGVPKKGRAPPLVRLAGVQAVAGHAPQGVQVQPGDRGGRVGGGRYFFSNIRWISVSAQAIGA